jgi:cation:H+ antiporter
VLLLFLVAVPAVALRLTGTHPPALASMLIFGLAVVAASFVLA